MQFKYKDTIVGLDSMIEAEIPVLVPAKIKVTPASTVEIPQDNGIIRVEEIPELTEVLEEERTENQLFQKRVRDMTVKERKEAGLVEIEEDKPVDGRFYFAKDAPRPIADCQRWHVNAINDYVSTTLAQYDWYILRAIDEGKPAPVKVVAYRKALRAWGNKLSDGVKTLKSAEACAKWQMHDWPKMED